MNDLLQVQPCLSLRISEAAICIHVYPYSCVVTDGQLGHMVQQQYPEASDRQIQRALRSMDVLT